MPDVYKVGLTTNAVSKRISELNTTGIPTKFKAEKIFEIQSHYLRFVERSVHQKLKGQGNHHGKEFFRISLDECAKCIEDCIYEVTNERALDVVGEAARRKVKAEAERLWHIKEVRRRESILENINSEIREQRNTWIQQLDKMVVTKQENESFWSKSVTILSILLGLPIFLFALLAFGAVFFDVLGIGIGIAVLVGLGVWWYTKEHEDNKDKLRKREALASSKFPLKTLSDIPERKYEASSIKGSSDQKSSNSGKAQSFASKSVLRDTYSQYDRQYKDYGRQYSNIVEKNDRAIHGRTDTAVTTKTMSKGNSIKRKWKKVEDGLLNKDTGELIPLEYLSLSATGMPGFEVKSFKFSTVWIQVSEIEQ